MKELTLGSLFSGSGTFEMAGILSGITPVWASEIEPFPIAVTRKRLPFMKHYGNISKLNGAELPPVDIITFGSPCTDLSVAGKRAGIQAERSGLFFEAIRIIKEMRCKTNGEYPKYIVWENVPGAFSSGGGEDFRCVLEEICKIADESAVIPKPAKWHNAGEILAGHTLDLSKYVDESLSRYVTIGISCDVSENVRACKLEVKSGTAATSPAIPTFEDTASKKHLTLAAIFLKGGAKTITDSNILDMRADEKKCGYVKCVLGKCRVSEMLVAVAFMTDKMNEMVGKIDTLQSTVDMLQLKVDDLTGDIIATGPLGNDIYYVLYSNGNLLIRGSGEMYNYDIDGNQSPFLGNNEIQTVVVSEGVTSVGDYLFGNCQNMKKITLPTTLTSIGQAAFMQGDGYANTVYGLTEITIPSGVTSIGNSVFWGSAIQNLVIPASVTEIGKYACRDCAALKSVTINGAVIGEFMFVSCTKLSTFNIGSKLKKIGSNVFNYCGALRTITYDGTLAKWQAIEKGANWDGRSAMETAQSGIVKIQCTDGYMEYADGAWREVIA